MSRSGDREKELQKEIERLKERLDKSSKRLQSTLKEKDILKNNTLPIRQGAELKDYSREAGI